MSNKDSIERKIRALMSKTTDNGATEAEMAAALEKAAELMAAHGITKLRERGSRVGMTKPVKGPFSRYDAWLAEASAIMFGCKLVGMGKNILGAFVFVGEDDAREGAKRTFAFLRMQVSALTKERKEARSDILRALGESPVTYARMFRHGCSMRVLMRARGWVEEQRQRDIVSDAGERHSALVVAGYFDKCAEENQRFLEGEGVARIEDNHIIHKAEVRRDSYGSVDGWNAGAGIRLKEDTRLGR